MNHRIALAGKAGGFNVIISKKFIVSEALFWVLVNDKIKLETIEYPDKLDENIEVIKNHLIKNHPITIGNLHFEIEL